MVVVYREEVRVSPPNLAYGFYILTNSTFISLKVEFYKTGTYFHYHRPTFKVAFNTSLEVVEATVTE